jgi:hypothetical protein
MPHYRRAHPASGLGICLKGKSRLKGKKGKLEEGRGGHRAAELPNAFVAQQIRTAVCARRAPLPPLGFLESIARSRIGSRSHLQRSDVLTASFAAQFRDSRSLVVGDLHASPRVTSRVQDQLVVVRVIAARRLAPPWRQIVPVQQQRRHALPPLNLSKR